MTKELDQVLSQFADLSSVGVKDIVHPNLVKVRKTLYDNLCVVSPEFHALMLAWLSGRNEFYVALCAGVDSPVFAMEASAVYLQSTELLNTCRKHIDRGVSRTIVQFGLSLPLTKFDAFVLRVNRDPRI